MENGLNSERLPVFIFTLNAKKTLTSECPSIHPLRNWNKFRGSNLNKSYTFGNCVVLQSHRGGTWAALQKKRSCWFQKQKVDPKTFLLSLWSHEILERHLAASVCCWGTCIPKSHFHVGWHILSKAGELNAGLGPGQAVQSDQMFRYVMLQRPSNRYLFLGMLHSYRWSPAVLELPLTTMEGTPPS